jgi:dipeptidase
LAVIPNYYTIESIDLADTVNCLGSADIIDYAVRRGWYDPSSGRPFSFRLAYADPLSLTDIKNIARHWQGINQIAEHPYSLNEKLPSLSSQWKNIHGKVVPDFGDRAENTAFSHCRSKVDPHVVNVHLF